MKYHKVYDLIENGSSEWIFPAIGITFIAFGIVFIVFRGWLYPSALQSLTFAFVGFGILWTILALFFTTFSHNKLSKALRENRCLITEGVVTEFNPMPLSGHGYESFIVSGNKFQYSDYIISPGFRKTQAHGGTVRKGVYVRVYYVGNDIARLEIGSPRK
ncbi:MAG: hypothetical protein K8R57_11280 [Verrucomicrobia bacterium]|nr:hypothetical protein [Verrucomicrobiota bacterium]